MNLPITLFLIYFVLLLLIAFTHRRVTGAEFAIANRDVSSIGIVAALAASFRDGAGIAVWIALAIGFGWGSLWLVAGMALALVSLSVLSIQVSSIAREKNWTTPTDWMRDTIGPRTAFMASVVIAGTAILYAAAQIYVAGNILSAYTGLSTNISLIAVAAVTGLYTTLGGYKAVTTTDKLQWLLILAILALPFLLAKGPSLPAATSWNSPGGEMAFGFAAISFLVVFSSGDVWQRIFSAKSGTVARKGLLLTIPVYVAISVGLVVFATSVVPELGADSASNALFEIPKSETISPLLLALFGLFAVASLMSTLDTQTFLFSSTLSEYLSPEGEGLDAGKNKLIGMALTTGFLLALVCIALFVGDIVEFLFSAVTLGTILFGVMLAAAIRPNLRSKDTEITIAILAGAITYIGLFATGKFSNLLFTTVPSLVTGIILIGALIVPMRR